MLDSFLEKLGAALQDAGARKRIVRRVGRILRRMFTALVVCHVALLVSLPALASWIGEKNVTLAFLLYMPRVIALLPLPFLLLPVLFFSRRLALLHLAAGLAFLTFGMGYEWRGSADARYHRTSGETTQLTALTFNRGQHANQSLQPFIRLTRPDIIALQESPGRAKRYLADANYSQFKHALDVGEHTLLSRYPILSGELIHLGADIRDNTPAARFEIDFRGRRVAVYSVHFITVRDTLLHYRRGAFLQGIFGLVPGTSLHRKMKVNQRFWLERIRTASALRDVIAGETLPTLVLGDFNAPSGGHIHRLFTRELQDAHQDAGSGCGYTFPGITRNPLSLGGPWMRIDYIMASRDWKVNACLTEEKRPSQHRAVAAKLTLK